MHLGGRSSKFGKRAKSAEDLKAALYQRLPRGSTLDEAMAWLRAEQIAFADEENDLRFTLRGPSRGLLVGVTWIVTLDFADDRLSEVVVQEGLTGP